MRSALAWTVLWAVGCASNPIGSGTSGAGASSTGTSGSATGAPATSGSTIGSRSSGSGTGSRSTGSGTHSASTTGARSSASSSSSGSGSTSSGASSTTGANTTTGSPPPPPDGGYRFPSTAIFYQDISSAPLDPNSANIISALDSAGGWGTGTFHIDFSMTLNYADPSLPLQSWDCPDDPGNDAGDCATPDYQNNIGEYYAPDCDLTPVPLPPGGATEGSPSGDYSCDWQNNDCHIFVYQGRRLFELYNATTGNGLWDGGLSTVCEVVWNLDADYWGEPQGGWDGGNYSRGDQCTSTDGAGMPVAPLLVTAGELDAGYVGHAIRFILPNPEMIAAQYVHPGTHSGAAVKNGAGGEYLPAYVSRLRLHSSFDTSHLTPAAKVVAQALMTFGMFLDDGGNIATTFDASAAQLIGPLDLAALQVTDFDVVQAPDVAYPGITYTGSCNRTPLTRVP